MDDLLQLAADHAASRKGRLAAYEKDFGIRNAKELANFSKTLLHDNNTIGMHGPNGRDFFLHPQSRTLIVLNYDKPSSSTIMRCRDPIGQWLDLKGDSGDRLGHSPIQVERGGYPALQEAKRQRQQEQQHPKQIEAQRQQAHEPREPARTHPGRSILESVNARTSQQRSAFHEAAARSSDEKSTAQLAHRLPRSLVERIKARHEEKQNREKVKDRGDKER